MKTRNSRCAKAAVVAVLALPVLAFADDASNCSAGAGTLLVGTVLSTPTYAPGKLDRGVALSHTHIRIRGDADGKTYDIAVDNVFA